MVGVAAPLQIWDHALMVIAAWMPSMSHESGRDWEYRSALARGQDNTSLVYLNDATILQNLRSRHQDHWVMDRSATIDFRLLTIRSLSPDQPLCFLKVSRILQPTMIFSYAVMRTQFNGYAGGCYLYIHSKRILTANQKQRLKVLFCSNDEEGLTFVVAASAPPGVACG